MAVILSLELSSLENDPFLPGIESTPFSIFSAGELIYSRTKVAMVKID